MAKPVRWLMLPRRQAWKLCARSHNTQKIVGKHTHTHTLFGFEYVAKKQEEIKKNARASMKEKVFLFLLRMDANLVVVQL